MPLYDYQCKQCERVFERFARIEDTELAQDTEAKATCQAEDCEGNLRRILSPVAFANMVVTGTTSRAIRNGKVAPDQMNRLQEQLTKRSTDYDRSPQGVEARDRAWHTYNQRFQKSAEAMGCEAASLPRKAFHPHNPDIKGTK